MTAGSVLNPDPDSDRALIWIWLDLIHGSADPGPNPHVICYY